MGGELGQRLGIAAADTRTLRVDSELGRLRGEQLGVASGRERDDLVGIAVAPYDVQGLGTDRPRGAEDDDAPRHQMMPRATTR